MAKQSGMVVIVIGRAERFGASVGYPDYDDRKNLWSADLSVVNADLDGASRTIIHQAYFSSGLVKDAERAVAEAEDKARTMQHMGRLLGHVVTIEDRNDADNENAARFHRSSEDYLEGYLADRARKAEKEAEAETLRQEAADLLARAAELVA